MKVRLVIRHGVGGLTVDVEHDGRDRLAINIESDSTNEAAVITSPFQIGPRELRTIEADIASWEAEIRRLRRSPDYIARGPAMVRDMAERFGWTTAAQGNASQICVYLAEKKGSGHTQNNRVAMTRAFFRHCKSITKSITSNPTDDIERAQEAKGDGMREFTAEEMTRLYQAARGHWKTAVAIFATTALRRGAVFRCIKFGWVDRAQRQLVIPKGVLKNRKAQTIPLNADAMRAIEEASAGRGPDDFIVPIRFDQDGWERLLQDAKIPRSDDRGRPAGTHSFRKGVLTELAELQEHPRVAQDLAGHSDIRLTMNSYTHLRTSHVAGAVKKLRPLNPEAAGDLRTSEQNKSPIRFDKADGEGHPHDAEPEGPPLSGLATQPSQNGRPGAGPIQVQHFDESSTPGRPFQLGHPQTDDSHPEGRDREPRRDAASTGPKMTPRGFEPRRVTPPGGPENGDTGQHDRYTHRPGAGSNPPQSHTAQGRSDGQTLGPENAGRSTAEASGRHQPGGIPSPSGLPSVSGPNKSDAGDLAAPASIPTAGPARVVTAQHLTDLIAAQRELVALLGAIGTHGAAPHDTTHPHID